MGSEQDAVEAVLGGLLASHGEVWREPARLRAFLMDLAPQDTRAVHLLVIAAELGIPENLIQSRPEQLPVASTRLSSRLVTERGVDATWATWVVEAWLRAVVASTAVPAIVPPPPPGPPATTRLTTPTPRPRRRKLAILGVLALVGVAAFVSLRLRTSDEKAAAELPGVTAPSTLSPATTPATTAPATSLTTTMAATTLTAIPVTAPPVTAPPATAPPATALPPPLAPLIQCRSDQTETVVTIDAYAVDAIAFLVSASGTYVNDGTIEGTIFLRYSVGTQTSPTTAVIRAFSERPSDGQRSNTTERILSLPDSCDIFG